jgi:hypothetical protein
MKLVSRWCVSAVTACAALAAVAPSNAAMLTIRDVTADLAPFINDIDDAQIGGGDTTGTTINLVRNFGTMPVGPLGTQVTLTGLGFGMPGNTNSVQEITATLTYFGADGVAGGTDNVDLGSVTFTHDFTTAGEYGVIFDTPIVGIVDGLNSIFRIQLTADSNIRIKNTFSGPANPSGQAGLRASVAGSLAAAVPEPTSVALASLAVCGAFALLRRRH